MAQWGHFRKTNENIHKHILKTLNMLSFTSESGVILAHAVPFWKVFALERCWGRRLHIQALLHIA